MGVKYEVMLADDDFNKLNDFKIENNESLYANPRNTVAGILSRVDGYKFRNFLTLVPISVRVKDQKITRDEELDFIDKTFGNNKIPLNGQLLTGTVKDIKTEIKNIYDEYTTKREDLGYMIDGLVVEVTDETILSRSQATACRRRPVVCLP